MTTQTLSRKAFTTINTAMHQTVYKAFTSLFLSDYSCEQYRCHPGTDNGFGARYGFKSDPETFVPVCEIVVGAKIRNKHNLPQYSAQGVLRLLKQTFAGKKAWIGNNVYVETKDLVSPLAAFIAANADKLDVFAGVYQNKHTYSNVFGVVVLLKDCIGEQRLSLELTIDDIDLANASEINRAFY